MVERVLHHLPRFDERGGVESWLMEVYRHIDQRRVQFDVIVDAIEQLKEFDEIRSSGGRVFLLRRQMARPLTYYRQFRSLVAAQGKRYCAFHAHDAIWAIPALAAAKQHGIPRRIVNSVTTKGTKLKTPFLKFVAFPVATKLATDLMVCPEFSGNVPSNRSTHHLRHAIDTSAVYFDPVSRMQTRSKYGLLDENIVIGNTGTFYSRLSYVFQLRIVTEAITKNHRARLLLAGGGPFERTAREVAEHLGISDKVVFADAQSDPKDLLSAMDVFLLPRSCERADIILLEAQASGLPCVISDLTPFDDTITECISALQKNVSPFFWAMTALGTAMQPRFDSNHNVAAIAAAGLDVRAEADALTRFYLGESR